MCVHPIFLFWSRPTRLSLSVYGTYLTLQPGSHRRKITQYFFCFLAPTFPPSVSCGRELHQADGHSPKKPPPVHLHHASHAGLVGRSASLLLPGGRRHYRLHERRSPRSGDVAPQASPVFLRRRRFSRTSPVIAKKRRNRREAGAWKSRQRERERRRAERPPLSVLVVLLRDERSDPGAAEEKRPLDLFDQRRRMLGGE